MAIPDPLRMIVTADTSAAVRAFRRLGAEAERRVRPRVTPRARYQRIAVQRAKHSRF